MDIIWIWNGNEDKNRCVAVILPNVSMQSCCNRLVVRVPAEHRSDGSCCKGNPPPCRSWGGCAHTNDQALLSPAEWTWKKYWIVLYVNPCSFLDIRCRLCATNKTVHLLFSTDLLQEGIQVLFWTTLAFFFAVIALLDWVFLKQMRSSPFSNLYCLFCIDSSWNPAKEWRLKLFSKYYMYKSW